MKKKIKNQQKNEQGEEREKDKLFDDSIKEGIIAVILIMIALIFLLSLFGGAGMVGEYVDKGLALLAGQGRYFLPLIMIAVGIVYFRKMEKSRYILSAIGGTILLLVILGILHLSKSPDEMIEVAKAGERGGWLGLAVAYPLVKLLGKVASGIMLFGLSLISLMLIFNASLSKIWKTITFDLSNKIKKEKKNKNKSEEEEEIINKDDNNEPKKIKLKDRFSLKKKNKEQEGVENIKPGSVKFVEGPKAFEVEQSNKNLKKKTSSAKDDFSVKKNIYANSEWHHPPISFFKDSKKGPKVNNLEETSRIIVETLKNFGIEVAPNGEENYSIGPTVTQYTFRPAVGVKLSRILALQQDLTLALAAKSIRIEAPIPGKSLIGVEVPNQKEAPVYFGTALKSESYRTYQGELPVILGEDVNGKVILADLAKMPHLLVAGATNTGKSVCINSILLALLYQKSPEDLRLFLVDPKRVELSLYNGIPHLLTPVIVDMSKVMKTLKWAVAEMEKRYKRLEEAGIRNIQEYNELSKRNEELEKMPYLVIIIDELADLMAAYGRDVEGLIVRLAQMARAVGIHLILSTQRPSVEVITGLIKANIVTRIALKVATQIDSRTILDMGGAEKLLGKGDMLYLSAEAPLPKRVQGIFISEQEVKRMVSFLKKQAKEINFSEKEDLSSSFEEEIEAETGIFSGEGTKGKNDEDLYEEAKELVIKSQKASTSMLQRRLSLGYSRAARIMDMLEENGIIDGGDGRRARKVLVGVEFEKKEVNYEDNEADQEKRNSWDEKGEV